MQANPQNIILTSGALHLYEPLSVSVDPAPGLKTNSPLPCAERVAVKAAESPGTVSAWLRIKSKIQFWSSLKKIMYINKMCFWDTGLAVCLWAGVGKWRWKSWFLGKQDVLSGGSRDSADSETGDIRGGCQHWPALAGLFTIQQHLWDAAGASSLPTTLGWGFGWDPRDKPHFVSAGDTPSALPPTTAGVALAMGA